MPGRSAPQTAHLLALDLRGAAPDAQAVGGERVRPIGSSGRPIVVPPPWTLVIEHALLSDAAQRARAAWGGFGVTVQHALLWNMVSEMLTTWGAERTRHVNPIDEWLAAGASVAAGTDIARPLNPMLNVWGMATRNTKSVGVQGPEHAIPLRTALALYTLGSAQLNGESNRRGSIAPANSPTSPRIRIDPLAVDVDALADLTRSFTMLGGQPTYDPDNRLQPS